MIAGHPDTPPDNADTPPDTRTPGVRYRTETRTRTVPHTIDGRTSMVTEQYTVQVPLPPRDWDRIVLLAATGLAVALLAAAVVWSTAAIGDLLSSSVHAYAAYSAALVFDAAWICCMAVEWLSRYDKARARRARNAGWAALLVAMAAIAAHGYAAESIAVGLIGASVSLLAKGVWTVVLHHTTEPLDPRTAQWLTRQRSETAARLALAGIQRQLDRADGQRAALLAATGQAPDNRPDTADVGPDTSGRADATVRAAVRAAAATLPGATPEAIAAHLSAIGIETDPDTVAGHLDASSATPLPPVTPIRPAVAEAVRMAVSAGTTEPSAVVRYVRTLHPDASPDTITRTLRRITKEAS